MYKVIRSDCFKLNYLLHVMHSRKPLTLVRVTPAKASVSSLDLKNQGWGDLSRRRGCPVLQVTTFTTLPFQHSRVRRRRYCPVKI